MGDRRSAFIDVVVSEIQVAAGVAPYATLTELIDIFSSVVDRVPEPATQMDRLILRRLLATATRKIYVQAGAARPHRAVEKLVAEADDPRVAFKAALAALRSIRI